MEKISVNEIFVSYQGEGRTVGVPSIFVRLQGCNLRCEFCDTLYAVDANENTMILDVSELASKIISLIKEHNVNHVVVTGGEPLLQQKAVLDLFQLLVEFDKDTTFEIETNGLIKPDVKFSNFDIQFNVSYKAVSHIKTTFDQYRIIPDAIFKIVVNPDTELGKDILLQLNSLLKSSELHRIYLMPECKDIDSYNNIALDVYKLSREFKCSFGTRFHILAKIK